MKRKITLWNGLVVLFGIFFVSFYLFPIYWNMVTSIRPLEEVVTMPAQLIPKRVFFERYITIFTETHFGQNIRNSLIISSIATALCLSISTFGAYAISRIRIRGYKIMLILVLVLSMLPAVSIISPLYLMFKTRGLINTHAALIITYTALYVPFSVWFLTSFFKTIPTALEDAAIIDGCSLLRVLTKVIIPLAAPAIFTVTILIFIFTWGEFLFALTFTTTHKVITAPVGIYLFQGKHEIPWGEMATAATVVSLQVVLVIIICQKYIVEGLTSGAVKRVSGDSKWTKQKKSGWLWLGWDLEPSLFPSIFIIPMWSI